MEKVNHPQHYNIPGKKECIEQMREDYGDYITAIFCLTNAYKYLYRVGGKEGETREDDIGKAIWYYEYQNNLKFSWEDSSFSKLYLDVGRRLAEYGKE